MPVIIESADGGSTWTTAHPVTYGFPSHFLRIADGRLLMSYGCRKGTFGAEPDSVMTTAKRGQQKVLFPMMVNALIQVIHQALKCRTAVLLHCGMKAVINFPSAAVPAGQLPNNRSQK